MTPPTEDPGPTKGAFDFVDLLTGRIGKITAFLTALGGLVLLILTQSEQILTKATALGLYTPRQCVEVEPLVIPAAVKYSEWDSMKLKLKGRNNCSAPLGLFVIFVPASASETGFVIRVPHEDLPECRSGAPKDPTCWNPKKPLRSGKGAWEWEVPPPRLARMRNPGQTEKISITWYVYDYDSPAKSAIQVNSATIEVQNDRGNPS
jgi:hypothetical protein